MGAAATRDGGLRDLSGIDKMVKGFKNAKVSTLSRIGVMELEKPELLERNSRYTGDRSMADVGAFIGRKQPVVAMLYEERLKVNPALEGKVTVVLVIEEDGTISSATVLESETTLDDPDFLAGLLRRIRKWRLPPSTGGPVEMKSPFVFKPA
jgi:TonB family protein